MVVFPCFCEFCFNISEGEGLDHHFHLGFLLSSLPQRRVDFDLEASADGECPEANAATGLLCLQREPHCPHMEVSTFLFRFLHTLGSEVINGISFVT